MPSAPVPTVPQAMPCRKLLRDMPACLTCLSICSSLFVDDAPCAMKPRATRPDKAAIA